MGLFDRLKKSLLGEESNPEINKQEKTKTQANKEVEETTEQEDQLSTNDVHESIEQQNDLGDEKDIDTPNEPLKEDIEVKESTSEQSTETIDGSKIEPVESTEDITEQVQDTQSNEQEAVESTKDEQDEKIYKKGLEKTNKSFGARLNAFFANFRSVDENFFDELEETLIESDVGYETALQLTDSLREEAKLQNAKSKSALKEVVIEKMVELYEAGGLDKNEKLEYQPENKPNIYLFVGVNGAGKTTTVGKLAGRLKKSGKSVLLVAADTFRAGAVAQLVEWGKRVDVPVITGPEKADPASVVYDGVTKAIEQNIDYLIIDTAGRLQNKVNLMNELDKIERTIKKILPAQPEEVLLVIDGSTGQNALIQAKEFNETTTLTGLVLTKIDGSSKGGVVLAIRNEMKLPVKLVGLGEKVDDLADFNAEKFALGLFHGLV